MKISFPYVEVLSEAQEQTIAELEQFLFRLPIDDGPVWVTKDQKRIPLRKMGDSHLVNAYRLVLRNRPWRSEWIPLLSGEISRRGL